MNKRCFFNINFMKVNLVFPDFRNSVVPGLSMVSLLPTLDSGHPFIPHFLAHGYKSRTAISLFTMLG